MLIGFASSGKSVVGESLAGKLGIPFIDLDERIGGLYRQTEGGSLAIRGIFKAIGEAAFRTLETRAIKLVQQKPPFVLATGGGAVQMGENRPLLKALGKIVYLKATAETLLGRMKTKGLPAYLDPEKPLESLQKALIAREPLYRGMATWIVDTDGLKVDKVAEKVLKTVKK